MHQGEVVAWPIATHGRDQGECLKSPRRGHPERGGLAGRTISTGGGDKEDKLTFTHLKSTLTCYLSI